jgi:tyrosine-protein kinase Etk/Wzc
MQLQNDGGSMEQQPLDMHGVGLSEYFGVLTKYRKFIGCIVGATFILSALVSVLLPKMYVATARIMPPQERNPGIASFIGGSEDSLSALVGNLMVNHTPAALYVGIMKSRNVADALNKKFKLKKLYDLKYIEDVYSKLEERSTIEVSRKDQIISVSVKDRDPQRASDMANTYVAMLDQINRELSITQGRRKRLFLEDRLKKVRGDLEKAEQDLKTFQEDYHLVSIEEQAKVAIEGAAEIKGQIVATQTELEVLKRFGTEKQVEAVMLKAKIEELQKQLDSIEKGQNPETDNSNPTIKGMGSNFYIPFNSLPRLGMQLMRLMREARIQEKLFELLTAQYEMAQIEEARDVDTVQVLDKAQPPEKKDSPKRTRIVLVSTFIALVGSVLIVFLRHYHHRFTL